MKSPVQIVAGATVLLIAAILLGLPLSGMLPSGAAAGTETARDSRMEIRDLVEAWAEAWEAGDPERLKELYSEDALSMRDGSAPLDGRAAILAAAEADMKAFDFDVNLQLSEIELSGNTAWAMGRLDMKALPRAAGLNADFGSHYMAVFARGADGKWRIHRDIQRRGPSLLAKSS